MEQIIQLLEQYGYLILFPIAAVEGPIVALLVGFLIFLGIFQLVPSMIILVLGDLIPDIVYYSIGKFGNKQDFVKKYSAKVRFISDNFHIVEDLWHKHTKKTMMVSKLAYGLSTPLLISAGLVNVKFFKFVTMSFVQSVIQYAVIISLGYTLGHSYQLAAPYVKNAGVIIAIGIIFFAAVYIVIARKARNKILEFKASDNPPT